MTIDQQTERPDRAERADRRGDRHRRARGARSAARRLPARTRGAASRGVEALRTSWVAQVAVGMIVLQVAFRAWTTSRSWFTMDDFAFLSRTMNDGISPSVLFDAYAGHVMPAGMFLSWLSTVIAPYNFTTIVVMLVVLQVVANAGLLVLLVRWFGLRPGILPPLALYLFCVISFPSSVWWAAGVNQIPLQAVLFWALVSHVDYLRNGRARDVWITVAWLVVGLLFFEKTVFVVGAIAIVSMAYFATGSLLQRVQTMWTRYRLAVVVYAVLCGVYLIAYYRSALNFEPGKAGNGDLPNVLANMVFHNYLPALVGGPWKWTGEEQGLLPDTGGLAIVISCGLVAYLVREMARTRTNSLRAWLLPVFFLACNVVLVAAGRSTFVGPTIALEYRYQGELAAVTAVALACAMMPIRGALERVEVRGTSALLDRPRRVAAVTVVAALTATTASVQYIDHWHEHMVSKPYFDNLFAGLPSTQFAPMIDNQVPNKIMWGLSYPLNLQSYLLKPYADDGRAKFTTTALDRLRMTDDDGNIVNATVPTVRQALPGRGSCGYQIITTPRTITLDGPVAFGGWWVRVGYIADKPTHGTFWVGDTRYELDLPAGVHAVYLGTGDASFNNIKASIDDAGVTLCTDDVTVGRPEPVEVAP